MNSTREDYLQAIYRICKKNKFATNKEIALYLSLSKPTVSEMLRKLLSDDLILITDKKITLSNKGCKQAEKLLSKHRLWEYFLENKLGMKGEIVHDQADRLEHGTSPEMFEALNEFLDFPLESPNGHTIFANKNKAEN